jgi:hypothetical protein
LSWVIAGAAGWLIALAAVLIFVPASNRYFRPQAAPVVHPAG